MKEIANINFTGPFLGIPKECCRNGMLLYGPNPNGDVTKRWRKKYVLFEEFDGNEVCVYENKYFDVNDIVCLTNSKSNSIVRYLNEYNKNFIEYVEEKVEELFDDKLDSVSKETYRHTYICRDFLDSNNRDRYFLSFYTNSKEDLLKFVRSYDVIYTSISRYLKLYNIDHSIAIDENVYPNLNELTMNILRFTLKFDSSIIDKIISKKFKACKNKFYPTIGDISNEEIENCFGIPAYKIKGIFEYVKLDLVYFYRMIKIGKPHPLFFDKETMVLSESDELWCWRLVPEVMSRLYDEKELKDS